MDERDAKGLVPIKYFLEAGFIFLTAEPAVISTVLGSCVSVCLYDRERRVGGMNHFQLPFVTDRGKATARYGNVATLALIRMMIHGGCGIGCLEAKIFGGAGSPFFSRMDIGHENVLVARKILAKKGIPIVSEDVGGRMGRKVIFNTSTSEVVLLKVESLRQGDWYPYDKNRLPSRHAEITRAR